MFVILGGEWNQLGQALSVGGLALALISFSVYTCILLIFIRRLRTKHPKVYQSPASTRTTLATPFSREQVHDVRLLLQVMAITCIGILVRSTVYLMTLADPSSPADPLSLPFN